MLLLSVYTSWKQQVTVGKTAVLDNFDVHKSFSEPSNSVANYSGSILFILYSFSGFEQPFYVRSIVNPFIPDALLLTSLSKGTQRSRGAQEKVCQSDHWNHNPRWRFVFLGECCICKSISPALQERG